MANSKTQQQTVANNSGLQISFPAFRLMVFYRYWEVLERGAGRISCDYDGVYYADGAFWRGCRSFPAEDFPGEGAFGTGIGDWYGLPCRRDITGCGDPAATAAVFFLISVNCRYSGIARQIVAGVSGHHGLWRWGMYRVRPAVWRLWWRDY